METDKIIVGRLLGVVETGYYYMAQRIAVLPTRELVSPLQRILFPSFSELVAEPNRLRGAVVESLNVIATLSLPAGFGFALIAEEFIPLVLGERWGVISPLLVVLTPYLGFRVILSVAIPCALSLGRTRLLFLFSLAYGAVHLPLFIVATAKFGLDGAIWSVVVAGTVHVALNAIMLNRLLGVTPKDIARQLRRPLLAALVMAGAILLFQTIKATGNGGSGDSLADLTQIVLGGVTVYATVLISLWWFEGRPAGFERRLLSLKESRTFK
jgi:lipopolysaccharide exporter